MFKKFFVMPLVIGLIPPTGLTLPGTVPLMQREQAIGGVLRWPVAIWDEAEFERVGKAIDSLTQASRGKGLQDYVMAVIQVVAKAIPNREFHLEVSSFGIDYKPDERRTK